MLTAENRDDPYQVLGLPPGAFAADIKRAYLKLLRQYPPEQRPEEFKRLRAAYEQLKDEKLRAQTDLRLFHLETGFLPRLLEPPSWPEARLLAKSLPEVLAHGGDLGRTDFREDLTVFPWEGMEDNRA